MRETVSAYPQKRAFGSAKQMSGEKQTHSQNHKNFLSPAVVFELSLYIAV